MTDDFSKRKDEPMKDKVPSWPVYAADALMFVAVLLVAAPYYNSGTPMTAGILSLCALMVFSSMLIALVPYWLDYRKDIASKAEHTREAEENFRIIFDDLSALRLGLAELEERSEKFSEALSDADKTSGLRVRFNELEAAVETFRDSLEKRLREIADTADSNAKALDACGAAGKETGNAVAAVSSEVSSLGKSLQSFRELFDLEIESLKKAVADLQEKLTSTPPAGVDEDKSAVESSVEKPPKVREPKVGSMLNKALAGMEISKASVDKFVKLGMDATDGVDGNRVQSEPRQLEIHSLGGGAENAGTAPALDSADGGVEGEKLFEVTDPEKSESVDAEVPDSSSEAEPPPAAQKPRKGGATVVVNALIGIGNKPFLRGSGVAGLSEEKGLEMEYVEIGKWRHVFEQIDSSATFTVLKNDSIPPNGKATFTISAGENLELNLSFPLSE